MFENSIGDMLSDWDHFWFLVVSWTRSSGELSSIPFNSFLCNLGLLLLPREITPKFIILINSYFKDLKVVEDKEDTNERYDGDKHLH